ncbi:MAG TPA: S8 family serine peptidase [Isosphaeraceae bacterium]|nr:S8 family serine peptidase [Isosphaeraceae bacterium]
MRSPAINWMILALVVGVTIASWSGGVKYADLLSSPGKLEIVRQPPAADYTGMPSHGKIESLPSYRPGSGSNWQVDLRSCDLSTVDLRDRREDLLHADFDSRTIWPARLPEGFDVARVMDLGKNPGLGLRALHARGITGAGVGIGIIDQALLVEHVEYKKQLRLYEEIHWFEGEGAEAQMHGPAVASIAVGKSVGVAPEADLYYIAEWHARSLGALGFEFDLPPLARSIDRLVAISKTLPRERRIRVISISLGINPRMKGFDLVKDAMSRAEQAGIYTVYVGADFMGLGREPLENPDEFTSFGPGEFWKRSWRGGTGSLMVPMDSRCIAGPTGDSDYAFYRNGGMSWAVPWVAGLYALACQVNPQVTPEIFWETARKTGVITKIQRDGKAVEFGPVVNPRGLLEALR